MIGAATLRDRLVRVAEALGLETGGTPRTLDAARTILVTRLAEPSAETSYLLLAAIVGQIPTGEEVIALERRWRLSGVATAIDTVLAMARALERWKPRRAPSVRIERGTVVDVHDTAHTSFTTGIQRVTRSVLPIWLGTANLTLVGWTGEFEAPRSLSVAEEALAGRTTPAPPARPEIVIPYQATWILPEIAVDVRRAARTRAIALYSGSRAVAIGYDCIPITSAETAGGGMPGGFANYLAALAEFDVIAPISGGSGVEFEGWRGMLGGAGLSGPRIVTVELATEAVGGTAEALRGPQGAGSPEGAGSPQGAGVVEGLGIGAGETVVLAVGSHEPRKNHLALLQAAELVWAAGTDFTLVMIGGNSWDRADFDAALAAARARGRRIILLTGAPDATVGALYERARFTVFPSLNEGFGLPVVESIGVGTPVITSDFGSMRESAEGFGGFLVDPRSDAAIAAAMTRLLTDDALLAQLTAETVKAPKRTWDAYATGLWTAFAPETT